MKIIKSNININIEGPILVDESGKYFLSTVKGSLGFFAYINNRNIGYIVIEKSLGEKNTFFVGVVFVEPEFRRLGISSKLHDEAFKYCKNNGYTLLSGQLNSENNVNYWKKLKDNNMAEEYSKGRYKRI